MKEVRWLNKIVIAPTTQTPTIYRVWFHTFPTRTEIHQHLSLKQSPWTNFEEYRVWAYFVKWWRTVPSFWGSFVLVYLIWQPQWDFKQTETIWFRSNRPITFLRAPLRLSKHTSLLDPYSLQLLLSQKLTQNCFLKGRGKLVLGKGKSFKLSLGYFSVFGSR